MKVLSLGAGRLGQSEQYIQYLGCREDFRRWYRKLNPSLNRIARSGRSFAAGGTSTRDRMTGALYPEGIWGIIRFAHTIDFVLLVLGELPAFQIQRIMQVRIIRSDGTVLEIVVTDVADHTMLQDTLSPEAPLTVTFRLGPPFKETPGFIWMIHGEKGDIRHIAPGPALHTNDEGTDSTPHSFDEELELIDPDRLFKGLPPPSSNVAAMYEAFASREDKIRILATQCAHTGTLKRHTKVLRTFEGALIHYEPC